MKQKQRLKTILMDYCGETFIILGTQVKCSEVIINSNNLESKETLKSNRKFMMRKYITDYCL